MGTGTRLCSGAINDMRCSGGEGDAGGILAATLADIGSDKLVALPMSVLTRNNPRHRDVWDLMWINGRMGALGELATRAAAKAASSGVAARYAEALRTTIDGADDLVGSAGFRGMLHRLFPEPLATAASQDPSWRQSLAETTRALCLAALRAFDEGYRNRSGGGAPPSRLPAP